MADKCKCMGRLEMLEAIEQASNSIVATYYSEFEDACPELYAMAVDHIVVRFVHTVIINSSENDVDDADVPNAVHQMVGEMQGRLPALIANILAEYKQKKEASGARH